MHLLLRLFQVMEEVFLNTSSSEEISHSFDAKAFATRIKENQLTLDRAREDYKHERNCCDVIIRLPQQHLQEQPQDSNNNISFSAGGDYAIKAHSVILSAYSKYFQVNNSVVLLTELQNALTEHCYCQNPHCQNSLS